MGQVTHHIVVAVEDKQGLIDFLEGKVEEGEQYAELCKAVLVNVYGATLAQIKEEKLTEMATGYLLNCQVKDIQPLPPATFIAERLASFSNIGLAKMGLSRQQYEKVTRYADA